MICDNLPPWVQILLVILALMPHLLALIPPQYKAIAQVVFNVLDKVAGNYAHCANAKPEVTDSQDKVTPRP